ncbi:neprilysin-1-like [Rhipicephalus sanguineus]|uniref:neprilysin-1-like n=1 Tax=Rhipicephalus sanguineus TaxID=34632 RepID=UPI001895EC32|nr:neprilysin-1-like [Rhipicephalus sanguineus]
MADARKASVASAVSKSSSSVKSSTSSKSKDSGKAKKPKKSRVPEEGKASVAPEPPPEPEVPESRGRSKEHLKAAFMMEKTSFLTTEAGPLLRTAPTAFSRMQPRKSISAKGQYVEASAKAEAEARYRGRVIMLLVVPAITVVLVLMAVVIYIVTMEKPRIRVDTCKSDDCAAFGKELHAAINWSIDPCQDFHAFVCGGWDDPLRQKTTESRMVAAALDLAIQEAKADLVQQGNAPQQRSKATNFFGSCIIAGTQKQNNLKEFADLRHSLGLLWPERNLSDTTHPLDIMVNLALNWEMNFLFDLGAVAVRQSIALLISRGRMDNVWEENLRRARTIEAYEKYVNDYYDVLKVNGSQIGVTAAELLDIEKTIIKAKYEFLYGPSRQDWFKVSALDGKTPSVPAGLWLTLLRKHDKQYDWKGEDTAIVEDVKILENLEHLLKALGHDKLITGMSWIFIQTHLWAVYGEPSLRFTGKDEELVQMQERGCMEYVGSRLGLLGWAKYFTDTYRNKDDRLHVTSFLHRINEQTKRLINKLSWMDSQNKLMVFSKLDKMSRVVLPSDSFFDAKKREELYSVFPDMSGNTFVTNLVNASKVYQRLRNHEHFADVYSIRMVPRYGRELYLYLANSMAIALVTLSPPMYYKDATLAIKYGAMGSFVAREMARAFDEMGVTVDDTGKREPWLGAEAAAAYANKANCDVRGGSDSAPWRPIRALPVMPGLEIAFEAFIAAVAVDYRALVDFKVLYLEMFTDLQIFFVAYCYSLCSKRTHTMLDECNVPAMNSPIFAEVFHCPVNSPMNPPKKCTFFDR